MTFLGLDNKSELAQLRFADTLPSKLLRFEGSETGMVEDGPLQGFSIEKSWRGLHFSKRQKYLSALRNARLLVVDRDVANLWETFTLVDEEKAAYVSTINQGVDQEIKRFRQVALQLHAEGRPVKLYVGSGSRPRPGFLNLDRAALKPQFLATNPDEYFIFPFADGPWDLPDNSVDYIFHEDFIEHVPQLLQIQFLAEMRRVLKPGAWHRVNTPNLITAMRSFSDFSKGFSGVYTGESKWGHIALFSPLFLKEMAELVGYREVIFTTKGHSVSPYADPDFRPGPDRDSITGNIFADLMK